MNHKTKPKRARIRTLDKKIQLSKAELDIMGEELADPEADKRNGPLLFNILCSDPDLLHIMFNPILLPMVLEQIHNSLNANAVLTQTVSKKAELFDRLTETLSRECEPVEILNMLILYFKTLKIKREKKAFLWAIGELYKTLHQKSPLAQSAVFRQIVMASLAISDWLFRNAELLILGKEPFHFNYQKVLDSTFTKEEWQRLFSVLGPHLRYFNTVVSITAFKLLEQIRRPVGLRFYHVIHYPSAVQTKTTRLIVLPHETTSEPPETSEEEQFEKKMEALSKDLFLYKQKDVVSELVSSLKAAAFGDIDPAQVDSGLNAVVFSLLFLRQDNFFLEKVYENSGDNAEKINPSDEVNYIIEIKSTPENPIVYRRYADWLYEKGETDGAYKVYLRWKEFGMEADETVETRLKELEQKFIEKTAVPVVNESQPAQTT